MERTHLEKLTLGQLMQEARNYELTDVPKNCKVHRFDLKSFGKIRSVGRSTQHVTAGSARRNSAAVYVRSDLR